LSDVPSELLRLIREHGQEHVLKFWDDLNETHQEQLVCQLEAVDFELFNSLQQLSAESTLGELHPSPIVPLNDTYREIGVERIKKGELSVLTVAGGQGTRLGWSGPKGTFPATPVTGKSLFQVVAEQILFAEKKYGVVIPWYIMTSSENDAVTRSFLLDNNCFGLERTDIFIFTQGEVPASTKDGKMLLSSQSSVAMNPDGHGGVISALKVSGGLEEMEARGIKYISYVQIDNPMANVVDPKFLGVHLSEESSKEVTSKCVKKTNPEERVGVFCLVDGKTTIVEYSDLPHEKTVEQNDNNELSYGAGSIAIHMLSTEFLQRVADEMPWHIAHKIVPHIDLQTGEYVNPKSPNANKYERFVFDVLPLAKKSLVVETERADEFAPIKNAEGVDSPSTSQQLQKDRAIRWLRRCSVEVSDNALVEISPLSGSVPEELNCQEFPASIGDGETVVL
jgi:UDP-N-acetylglucosamine/UDP-N-acetylgalactosamine diphosphorylase